ncbi:MAG: ASCH domain-containing protein [Erysipelotrichaceae bacterium]|nr:ASCH domain-containing protein [Erysipelotrichaceae bacterium]
MDSVKAYWQEFLIKTHRDPQTCYFEASYFGSTQLSADHLADLIRQGKKQATTSSALAYRCSAEEPQIGSLSIVTDWQGNPQAVIQTVAVVKMKFSEMTFDLAVKEGEDANLASWISNHAAFFQWESTVCGYEFNQEMPIIFEEFTVVYQ